MDFNDHLIKLFSMYVLYLVGIVSYTTVQCQFESNEHMASQFFNNIVNKRIYLKFIG